MEELKITYLRPEELTPYDGNTRKHAPEDIGQIKASIQADGFNDPIGIWGSHNLIVEGHGRRIAAMELGLERVPCIRLDHLTEAQRRDYAIRHNYTSDLSEFDFGKLDEEVAALQLQGMDMSYLEDLKDELTELDIRGGVSDTGFTDEFILKDGDRDPVQTMTFTFSDTEAEVIKKAILVMKRTQRFKDYENPENMNGNGNALFLVVEEWLRQKT